MSLSANQLYKQSGSKLGFKDWLKNQTENGVLEDFRNADGEGTKNDDGANNNNRKIMYLAVGLLVGYLIYKKLK